jgi:plasmid stabilization system protein ParE
VTGNVVKLLTALRDLDEAADYIRRQSGPERAIRFLREADATFQRLASMPGIGTRYAPDEPVFADLRYDNASCSREGSVVPSTHRGAEEQRQPPAARASCVGHLFVSL